MVIIGDILCRFVARYLFASAKILSRYFGLGPSTVKEVVSSKLRFRKYARRWVPHLLDDAQKNHRRASAIELLELLPVGKPMLLIGLQLVMSRGFTIITNHAKSLQRREKQ
jgi:hypothetical protein